MNDTPRLPGLSRFIITGCMEWGFKVRDVEHNPGRAQLDRAYRVVADCQTYADASRICAELNADA